MPLKLDEQNKCANCGVNCTVLWRRNDNGRYQCNECNLFCKINDSYPQITKHLQSKEEDKTACIKNMSNQHQLCSGGPNSNSSSRVTSPEMSYWYSNNSIGEMTGNSPASGQSSSASMISPRYSPEFTRGLSPLSEDWGQVGWWSADLTPGSSLASSQRSSPRPIEQPPAYLFGGERYIPGSTRGKFFIDPTFGYNERQRNSEAEVMSQIDRHSFKLAVYKGCLQPGCELCLPLREVHVRKAYTNRALQEQPKEIRDYPLYRMPETRELSSYRATVSKNLLSISWFPTESCELHPTSSGYFCLTCSRMQCELCNTTNEHDSHKKTSVKEIVGRGAIRAKFMLEQVEKAYNTLKDERRKTETAMRATVHIVKSAFQELDEFFVTIFRRNHLSISRNHTCQMSHYRRQILCDIWEVADERQKFLTTRMNQLMQCQRDIHDVAVAVNYAITERVEYVNPYYLYTLLGQLESTYYHITRNLSILMPIEAIAFEVPEEMTFHRPSSHTFRLSSPPPMDLPQIGLLGTGISVAGSQRKLRLGIEIKLSTKRRVLSIGNTSPISSENLCRPWGAACDSEGAIYVADRLHHKIRVYGIDGESRHSFGSEGTGIGQFNRPVGIAVDSRLRVIVVDKDNHRVQVFTKSGDYLLLFGGLGGAPGEFFYPWDVATNSECQIAISDSRNNRVQLFSAEGVFLREFKFPTPAFCSKVWDEPRGLAFDPFGRIVVTEFNNQRIYRISPDFKGCQLVSVKPENGEKSMFRRLQQIAIDDDGNMIVADSRGDCIHVLNPDGRRIWKYHMVCNETPPCRDIIIDSPCGVALHPSGRIIIVDEGHSRLVRLSV